MKWCRKKYHYAVRQAKNHANQLKSEALGQAAADNNLEFFKLMKTTLGTNPLNKTYLTL